MMVFNYDAIVVGCGLSGAVVARELAEKGRRVAIFERRNHIGGNMYDYVDDHGILVHKYGPHTFHTNSKMLFDYVCQYEDWQEYHLKCGAVINGKCTPVPFNFQTIDDFFSIKEADTIKRNIVEEFGSRKVATVLEVLEHKNPIIRKYGEFLFKNDYSLYTAKQWGIAPTLIDPSILKRVPLRFSYEEGYFDDKFQVMPKHSYTEFFKNILSHRNIKVFLNISALDFLHIDMNASSVTVNGKPFNQIVIYTGAIDELLNNSFGNLPYRSLEFVWKSEEITSKQKYAVVAYPQSDGYTRIVEFKKLPEQFSSWTTYEIEYPVTYSPYKNEAYYPVLTETSMSLYRKYESIIAKIPNLYLCGRLAKFKYFNMDQALDSALNLVHSI